MFHRKSAYTYSDTLYKEALSSKSLSSNRNSLIYESFATSQAMSGIILDHLLEDEDDSRDTNFHNSFPSGSFGMLEVLLGGSNAYVDVRKRLFDEFAHTKAKKIKNAKAALPMDIAAGWFMLKALGGKITDAYGNDLDNLPLWSFDENGKWTDACQLSIVAAVTPEIHEEKMKKINAGFTELKSKFPNLQVAIFPGMD